MNGTQMNIPVGSITGTSTTPLSNGNGWQGMSIKDILEKVDLFNFTTLVDDGEDTKKQKDNTNSTNLTDKESPLIPDLKVSLSWFRSIVLKCKM